MLERDESISDDVAAEVRALAARDAPSVQVDVTPGSAKLAVRFEDDQQARRFAEVAFANRLAKAVRVLPNRDPALLELDLADESLRIAQVAPRLVMTVFQETRQHFERRSSLRATVKTVPGQSRYEVRFERAEDRAQFVAWMAADVPASIAWMRYSDKASRPGAALVDVVPAGVGFVLVPEVRFYAKHSSPTTEVAIQSTFEHDLYLAMRPQQGTTFITLLAIVFPFVSFLWLGAVTMLLGAAISMWPTGVTARVAHDSGARGAGGAGQGSHGDAAAGQGAPALPPLASARAAASVGDVDPV